MFTVVLLLITIIYFNNNIFCLFVFVYNLKISAVFRKFAENQNHTMHIEHKDYYILLLLYLKYVSF